MTTRLSVLSVLGNSDDHALILQVAPRGFEVVDGEFQVVAYGGVHHGDGLGAYIANDDGVRGSGRVPKKRNNRFIPTHQFIKFLQSTKLPKRKIDAGIGQTLDGEVRDRARAPRATHLESFLLGNMPSVMGQHGSNAGRETGDAIRLSKTRYLQH